MHQDNRLWILIARKLSSEASPAELRELEACLGENASDQYLFEMLYSFWNQHPEAHEAYKNETVEKFNRIIKGVETSPEITTDLKIESSSFSPFRSASLRKWTWVAGVAALFVVGIRIYINAGKTKDELVSRPAQSRQNEVVAKKGTRSRLILPDGTQVWLNADSKISYFNTFNNELREVNLEGEAFFDVVKDAKHPFVVHTSGIDIKVLGTTFNVKSYQQESTIETTLLRGMIEVTTRDDNKTPKVILRPHEKLVFKKTENELGLGNKIEVKPNVRSDKVQDPRYSIIPVVPKPDSATLETSWVYNKLIFEGENFKEVALKMERWYNVKISFHDEKLMGSRIHVTFQNETIEQALDALKLIAKFDYVRNGSDVEIVRSRD
jgi:ferric-dicitrate binding protein FerR (iron transport regulator)